MLFIRLAYIILLLISPLSLATQVSSGSVNPRVINGISTKLNQLPWQVSINFSCGGTIIAPKWVLTAAHCVVDQDGLVYSDVDVTSSTNDLSSSENRIYYTGDFVVAHPEYDTNTKLNDIALVKLSETIFPSGFNETEFPTNTSIKVLSKEEQSIMDRQFLNEWVENQIRKANLVASGWGGTDPSKPRDSSTNMLQQTLLSGVPVEQCIAAWESLELDSLSGLKFTNVICATSPDPELATDTCFGDSGGPLVWQNPNNINEPDFGLRLVGVVSFGYECGTPIPGVYTKVSDYIDWIESTIGIPVGDIPASTFTYDPFKDDYSKTMNHGVVMPDYRVPVSDKDGGSTSLPGLLLLTGAFYFRKRVSNK